MDSYKLSWNSSSDNIGVLGYNIYNGEELIGATAFTRFIVSGLSASTTYNMTVRAIDSEGNTSEAGPGLDVTTSPNISVDTSGILMEWDFVGMGGYNNMPASKIMTGISTSHSSGFINTGSVFVPNNFTTNGLSAANQSATTLNGAVVANEFFSFSIAPYLDNIISIDSIRIRVFSENQSRNFTLMSNMNGFISGNEIGTISGNDNTVLQSINVNGHINLNSSVEFRIYVWGPNDADESFGIGNRNIVLIESDLIIFGSVKSPELPDFPTDLSISSLTQTDFTLNWKRAKNAVLYEVFKNEVSVGTTTDLFFSVTEVDVNSTYSMTVTAEDNLGNVWSSIPLFVTIPDLTAPSIPQNLTVTDITESSFILNWEASTDNVGVIRYEVIMDDSIYGNTAENYLQFSSLIPNTSYLMKVRAFDSAENVSPYSDDLNVTIPDLTAPSTPQNLTVTDITKNSFILHWEISTDNVGVIRYEVIMDDDVYGNTAENYLLISSLTPNTSYLMKVRAFDSAENVSPYSVDLQVKTLSESVNLSEKNIDDIKIYPNPASEQVNISISSNHGESIIIKLLSIQGKEVLSRRFENPVGKNVMNINTSSFDNGVYFMIIIDDEDTYNLKFVINR
jgi:chitodextrinase